MANTIKVKTDTLQAAARQLSRAASDLESLCSSLPPIHDPRLSRARTQLFSCRSKGRTVTSRIRRTSNGAKAAASVFSQCERRLVTRGRAVGQGGLASQAIAGAIPGSVPPASMPTFSDLIFDSVGGFGIAGGLISSISKFGYQPDAKTFTKMLTKGGKSLAKWAEFKKHTKYNIRNKKLFNLQPFLKNPSVATKWSLRFKRNFAKGFQKGWWDKTTGAATKIGNVLTWGGAVIGAGIDNYREWKDGKISADRAVVEGAVETVGTVALAAGASALVAALAPVALPGVAVAVAGAAVVWGADYIAKKITGKGVVEGVGWVAGEVYDGAKVAVKGAVKLAKDTGAKVINGVKAGVKWVKGLFKSPRLALGW